MDIKCCLEAGPSGEIGAPQHIREVVLVQYPHCGGSGKRMIQLIYYIYTMDIVYQLDYGLVVHHGRYDAHFIFSVCRERRRKEEKEQHLIFMMQNPPKSPAEPYVPRCYLDARFPHTHSSSIIYVLL